MAVVLAFTGPGPVSGAGDNGAVSMLVRSNVALTADVQAAIGAHAAQVGFVWPEIRSMAVKVNEAKLAELRADPRVALVEADGRGSAPGENADGAVGVAAPTVLVPLLNSSSSISTWNQDMADTQGTGFTGRGVTVAVVDSGLPQNYEDFLPEGTRVDLEHAVGFGAEGWSSPDSHKNAVRGVGGHVGLFPHGLAVSSVIVGFPSEAGAIGGAAPDVTILPVQVLNQFNYGWSSWFTAGIMHVARLKASGAIPGPLVINFSIQQTIPSAVEKSAIDYAISQGVVFVTIAGNFGPGDDSISFPGRLPESITAGAVGWRKEWCGPPVCAAPWFFADVPENDPLQPYVATFSGRESVPAPSPSAIDVLAPGSFVFGEWLFGPGFSENREVAFDAIDNFIFGTSFAAPHVVGIVAQMLEKNPTLNQGQVEALLRGSALSIAPAPGGIFTPAQFVAPWGANATGSGLVRGTAAVAATP